MSKFVEIVSYLAENENKDELLITVKLKLKVKEYVESILNKAKISVEDMMSAAFFQPPKPVIPPPPPFPQKLLDIQEFQPGGSNV